MIKCGKPVVCLSYLTLKRIAVGVVILSIINIFYCTHLLLSAVKIKYEVGDFINMVTDNDGDAFLFLLILPAVLSFPLNIMAIYLLSKAFQRKKTKKTMLNAVMFAFILITLGSCLTMLIACIMILTHIFSTHEGLHDGILSAMKNYSTSLLQKSRIDLLQMEFQCCGSKGYQEWYYIKWFDENLIKNSADNEQVPFSCCSIESPYPCIHHHIESSLSAYQYSKKVNLSISSDGCFETIKTRKKSVGWRILGKVFLLAVIKVTIAIGLRFVQTAHFVTGYLDPCQSHYLTWLFGTYKRKSPAPPVPPLPDELMREQ